MTVALGTSTPTSMTVVATSTSMRPAAKSVIARSFSSGVSRPCSTREPQAVQRAVAQLGSTSVDRERRPAAARPAVDRRCRPTSSSNSAMSAPMRGQTT